MQENNLMNTDPEESFKHNWDEDPDLREESALPDYQHTPPAPDTAKPKDNDQQQNDQDLIQMI